MLLNKSITQWNLFQQTSCRVVENENDLFLNVQSLDLEKILNLNDEWNIKNEQEKEENEKMMKEQTEIANQQA